ncbi:MAG TPA: DUF4179 domain-containing protein, partial [Clostridiales bacterium]|nr:DUF4179 domain-containing protein [Clostridiales bacterium]
MREKEFKAVFDGEKYVMPQELKYRVKNKITEKTAKTRKPFVKRSVSAMVSIVLASVMVITVAAVGGIALFKSIYGENIDLIMPYSEEINLTASDENYELTLHEAVADEYTTAYIFSIKRLTLGASEAESENASSMIFNGMNQTNQNNGTYLIKDLSQPYGYKICYFFNQHDLQQVQIYRTFLDMRIKLICADKNYEAENTAKYLIRSIEDLKTENTDYYALYIINGENQALSVAVGTESGPEIILPKVTQKAPSITRSVQEYYRQYLKQTHPTMIFSNASLSDMITITPLAVYIQKTEGYHSNSFFDILSNYSIRYINGAFYRTAELVFNDGIEKSLSEMSQNEMGIRLSDTMGVYLFDEVLDTSLVKSFMVYDTVEFPMDVNLPVIDRETGEEIVPQYEAIDLMYNIGTSLSDYLDSMYPKERKTGYTYCGSPIYIDDHSCRISGHDCDI